MSRAGRRPSQRSMKRVRERVKALTPRRRCHEGLRRIIADVNPVLRGWGEYFRTGNAAQKFNQHLRPGEMERWTRDALHALGVHRLRGTVRYPEAV